MTYPENMQLLISARVCVLLIVYVPTPPFVFWPSAVIVVPNVIPCPERTVPRVSEPDIIDDTVNVVPAIEPINGQNGGIASYLVVADVEIDDGARAIAIPGYNTGV